LIAAAYASRQLLTPPAAASASILMPQRCAQRRQKADGCQADAASALMPPGQLYASRTPLASPDHLIT